MKKIVFLIISSFLPTFLTESCSYMDLPPYAYFLQKCGNNVQDNCYIGCLPRFDPIGSCYRVCQDNGTWSGIRPQCLNLRINCPSIEPPTNGEFVNGCLFVAGSTCIFRCDPGFNLVGDNSIYCRNTSQWSAAAPICQKTDQQPVTCSKLIPPINGKFVLNNCSNMVGSTCQVICDNNYQIVGNSLIKCQTGGTWSSSLPLCKPSNCLTINPPPNGALSGQCAPGILGQRCSFLCNTGFTFSGVESLICQSDGKWSSDPLNNKCQPRFCPALSPPKFGATSGSCAPGVIGKPCNFICYSGYILIGESKSMCLPNARWSNKINAYCQQSACPALRPPINGGFSGSCSPGYFGRMCIFYCKERYDLLGFSNATCLENGQWNRSPPKCEESGCGNLKAPYGGLFINDCEGCPTRCPGKPGQTCKLLCSEGFKLLGSGKSINLKNISIIS